MKETDDLRGLKITLGSYVVIFGMKITVYFMSGVMALLAKALHTLSDIFISAFLMTAAYYSRKKADETHMFGYSRAQYVAALVAATLFISFTSFELYREAIPSFFQPEVTEYKNLSLAIGVLAISMVIAAFHLVQLLRQKRRGAAAKAQLMELVNDELGLLAALAGTLFVAAGKPIADPIAAATVTTIIAYNAVRLFRENLCYLLGRSPGNEYLNNMAQAAKSVAGVQDIHELRAEYIGPDVIHAGMHLVLPRGLPVEDAEQVADEVRRKIHEKSEAGYCFIQVEAAPLPLEVN